MRYFIKRIYLKYALLFTSEWWRLPHSLIRVYLDTCAQTKWRKHFRNREEYPDIVISILMSPLYASGRVNSIWCQHEGNILSHHVIYSVPV